MENINEFYDIIDKNNKLCSDILTYSFELYYKIINLERTIDEKIKISDNIFLKIYRKYTPIEKVSHSFLVTGGGGGGGGGISELNSAGTSYEKTITLEIHSNRVQTIYLSSTVLTDWYSDVRNATALSLLNALLTFELKKRVLDAIMLINEEIILDII
jgi:hypothetical protein